MNQNLQTPQQLQSSRDTAKTATQDFIDLAYPYRVNPYWQTALREIGKLSPYLPLQVRFDALMDIAEEYIVQLKHWPIFRKRAKRLADEYGLTLPPEIM